MEVFGEAADWTTTLANAPTSRLDVLGCSHLIKQYVYTRGPKIFYPCLSQTFLKEILRVYWSPTILFAYRFCQSFLVWREGLHYQNTRSAPQWLWQSLLDLKSIPFVHSPFRLHYDILQVGLVHLPMYMLCAWGGAIVRSRTWNCPLDEPYNDEIKLSGSWSGWGRLAKHNEEVLLYPPGIFAHRG